MLDNFEKVKAEIENFKIKSLEDAENFNKLFLSRKGFISDLFSSITKESADNKKSFGQKINSLKEFAKSKYEDSFKNFSKIKSKKASLSDDLTMPLSISLGAKHPISITIDIIRKKMQELGFFYDEGKEIEDEWHNFTALNFLEDHPAREMQDTFYINNLLALRSQTSTSQIHNMEKNKAPLKIFSCGKCYRREDISSRSHCFFHQIEALYVDEGVSFVDLKNHLSEFIKAIFGKEREIRLRASYFPFTEPSAEVDMSCFCKKKGCRLCKYSGWVEIGGAGMVDPNVLINCKVDSEQYTGFAWGFGIERIAMLLFDALDIRLFSENNKKFLSQFISF